MGSGSGGGPPPPPPKRKKKRGSSKDSKKNYDGDDDGIRVQARGFTFAEPKDDEIDFLKDKPGHMTYGRRIALWLGSKYTWYYPHAKARPEEFEEEPPKPSLAKAWAFFEHVTLNRYVVDANNSSQKQRSAGGGSQSRGEQVIRTFHKGDRALDNAEPGEKKLPTKLYSPLTTPLKQLGDFGLGYGIYFSSLRDFAILFFIIGLLNIFNIAYYSGDEYSNEQPGVTGWIRGSAICTDQTWVPCPGCTEDEFEQIGVSRKRLFDIPVAEPANGNNNGDYIDISNYLRLGVAFGIAEEEEDSTAPAEWLRPNGASRLNNDFGILITEDEISNSRAAAGAIDPLPCRKDCLKEYAVCIEGGNTGRLGACYLDVSELNIQGDTVVTFFTFALKNNCDGATTRQGFINYVSLFIFAFGMIIIRRRQNALQVKFDEDEQTAQDYSIAIMNPPEDATDPSEWKRFFESRFDGCKVVVCTVGVDNDVIVQNLVRRREILHKIEMMLPPGTSLDDTTLREEVIKLQKEKQKKGFFSCLFPSSPLPKLVDEMHEVEGILNQELTTSQTLKATDVFITFQMESHQRDVLSTLSLGALAVKKNDASALPDTKFLFRRNLVLDVVEPDEPSTIRWLELHAQEMEISLSLLKTNVLTFFIIIICYFIITSAATTVGPIVGGYATTIIIAIFPMIAKALMGMEHHRSETSRQKWLFIKVAFFNVIITAVLINVNTPFTNTIDPKVGSLTGMITSVHVLVWASISTIPVLQYLDIAGNVQRHLVAPRAKTQEGMNMCMRGSEIMLAERYGQLYKYLFLIIWFSVIYPQGFFLGSMGLFVMYFSDRFSLMRSWARTPQLGSQISDFARNYFNPLAILFFCIIAAYTWSGFPFDDLCPVEDLSAVNRDYFTTWNVNITYEDIFFLGVLKAAEGEIIETTIVVDNDAEAYRHCNQDLRLNEGRSFPPLPKWQPDGLEWMTEDQEQIVRVYGWTCVAFLIGVILVFVFRFIRAGLRAVKSDYSPVGKDMKIPFTEVPSIDSYIPQVISSEFAYPLILCDISNIDEELFSWVDHDKPHSYYDISKDVSAVLFHDLTRIKCRNPFSRVKYWPQKKKTKLSSFK